METNCLSKIKGLFNRMIDLYLFSSPERGPTGPIRDPGRDEKGTNQNNRITRSR
jgi:hypothetical protein